MDELLKYMVKEEDGTDRADHDDDEEATCPEDYDS